MPFKRSSRVGGLDTAAGFFSLFVGDGRAISTREEGGESGGRAMETRFCALGEVGDLSRSAHDLGLRADLVGDPAILLGDSLKGCSTGFELVSANGAPKAGACGSACDVVLGEGDKSGGSEVEASCVA
jgi:hypothetical protein